MTQREFFEQVISLVDDETSVDPVAIRAKAVQLVLALNAKNEKRTSADSKEKKETSARRSAVLAVLSANVGKWFTRDDIALEIGGITPNQVTSACTALVKADTISKMEQKFGKSRKTVYAVLPTVESPEESPEEETVEETEEA